MENGKWKMGNGTWEMESTVSQAQVFSRFRSRGSKSWPLDVDSVRRPKQNETKKNVSDHFPNYVRKCLNDL